MKMLIPEFVSVNRRWCLKVQNRFAAVLGVPATHDKSHFLPELFAVYQCYRYENEHPLLYTAGADYFSYLRC